MPGKTIFICDENVDLTEFKSKPGCEIKILYDPKDEEPRIPLKTVEALLKAKTDTHFIPVDEIEKKEVACFLYGYEKASNNNVEIAFSDNWIPFLRGGLNFIANDSRPQRKKRATKEEMALREKAKDKKEDFPMPKPEPVLEDVSSNTKTKENDDDIDEFFAFLESIKPGLSLSSGAIAQSVKIAEKENTDLLSVLKTIVGERKYNEIKDVVIKNKERLIALAKNVD